MEDLFEFAKSLPGILIILFVGIGWMLTSIISSWSKHWRDIRLGEAEAALKTKMVERGMSADEIERVLRSEQSPKAKAEQAPLANPPKQTHGPLFSMIANGAEAQGMVRVIEAGLPVKETPADVASWMSDNGYDVDDIAVVLQAMKRGGEGPKPERAAEAPRGEMPDIDLELRGAGRRSS
jgi:hypothetical protein